MVGRAVLAQLVLAQLSVYWAHLFYIPASVIHSLNRMTTNFIWGGNKDKSKYYFSKLSNLTLPEKHGGWGIMDLQTFGMALLCKSLWRGVSGDIIWSRSIRKMYMASRDISFWYRKGTIGSPQSSAIWMSSCKIESFLFQSLA